MATKRLSTRNVGGILVKGTDVGDEKFIYKKGNHYVLLDENNNELDSRKTKTELLRTHAPSMATVSEPVEATRPAGTNEVYVIPLPPRQGLPVGHVLRAVVKAGKLVKKEDVRVFGDQEGILRFNNLIKETESNAKAMGYDYLSFNNGFARFDTTVRLWNGSGLKTAWEYYVSAHAESASQNNDNYEQKGDDNLPF
jgi:hypothetical protein